MCQPYIESATALSDKDRKSGILQKIIWRFENIYDYFHLQQIACQSLKL